MKFLLYSMLMLGTSAALAAPYPLGTMTCDDIGAFASEAMTWRKSHIDFAQAQAKLEEREYGDPVEKKNLTIILDYVYGSFGNNWSVVTAGNVMRNDCRKGREDEAQLD